MVGSYVKNISDWKMLFELLKLSLLQGANTKKL